MATKRKRIATNSLPFVYDLLLFVDYILSMYNDYS